MEDTNNLGNYEALAFFRRKRIILPVENLLCPRCHVGLYQYQDESSVDGYRLRCSTCTGKYSVKYNISLLLNLLG